jgi:hypothetical protein
MYGGPHLKYRGSMIFGYQQILGTVFLELVEELLESWVFYYSWEGENGDKNTVSHDFVSIPTLY